MKLGKSTIRLCLPLILLVTILSGCSRSPSTVKQNPVSIQIDPGGATEFSPNTKVTFSVAGYDPDIHRLTWSIDSLAPVALTSIDGGGDHPHRVSLTTLPVVADTSVAVSVVVVESGGTQTLSTTIKMQPHGDLAYSYQKQVVDSQQINETLQRISTADLNDDGYQDLLFLQDGKLSYALNNAQDDTTSGNNFHPLIELQATHAVSSFEIGDINQNGFEDIILVGNSKLTWLANAVGEDRFTEESILTLPSDAYDINVKVADLNSDQNLDIVVVYSLDEGLEKAVLGWFEQTADAQFKGLQVIDDDTYPGNHFFTKTHFTIADFNDDDIADIMVAAPGIADVRPVYLFINNNNGDSFDKSVAFELDGSFVTQTFETSGIATIDVNQDGLEDVVTWQTGNIHEMHSGSSAVFLNGGNGSFQRQELNQFFSKEVDVTIIDVDGDGDDDLVHGINAAWSCEDSSTCNERKMLAGQIAWQENIEGVIASEPHLLGNSPSASLLYLADIDNDNDIDILNADLASGELRLYLKE